MLAFVTSLRHPLNSDDYGRVEALLRETLRSVCAQTSDEFAVFVVGNEEPRFPLPDPVTFVPVDFPPPVQHRGPMTPRQPFVWDKGTKIGIGLAAARQVRPDHVMIFDADDFVHRRLAQYAADRRGEPGWVLTEGYMYSSRRRSLQLRRDFNRTCGTSHIVRFDAYGVPDNLAPSATQVEVADAYGDRLGAILGAHRDAVHWLADHGYPLAPLPFRGAVYQVDTGENHSGKGMRGLARPLGTSTANDFTIPLHGSPIRRAWNAFGPAYVAESAGGLARRALLRLQRPAAVSPAEQVP